MRWTNIDSLGAPDRSRGSDYKRSLIRTLAGAITGHAFSILRPWEWRISRELARIDFPADQDVLVSEVLDFLEDAYNDDKMGYSKFFDIWNGKIAPLFGQASSPAMAVETRDRAALAGRDRTGGIDFKDDKINPAFVLQNKDGEIKFHIDPALPVPARPAGGRQAGLLAEFQNTSGFKPEIISIQPLKSPPDFFGSN